MIRLTVAILLIVVFFAYGSGDRGVDLQDFYSEINNYRENLGLSFVKTDEGLERLALSYSKVMARNGRISHHLLTEESFIELSSAALVSFDYVDEILQSGPENYMTAHVIANNFYGSPDHNFAITQPGNTYMGAGFVISDSTLYFTAYFTQEEKWQR
jgi:uncharacterized protein YkwD